MRNAVIAAALCAGFALTAPASAYDANDLSRLASGDDCSGCDLSGADLTAADLAGAILVSANLSGADLSGADLRGAILDRANLQGANLTQADLSGASLRNADLENADLTDAEVWACDFTGANLQGAEVTGADFSQAINADLFGAIDHTPSASPAPPKSASPDLRVGSVFLVSFPYCPEGSLEADGRTLTIVDNQILYSLYGIAYGGDGKTDFKLPDLRAKVPLPEMHYCVVSAGVYPVRS